MFQLGAQSACEFSLGDSPLLNQQAGGTAEVFFSQELEQERIVPSSVFTMEFNIKERGVSTVLLTSNLLQDARD